MRQRRRAPRRARCTANLVERLLLARNLTPTTHTMHAQAVRSGRASRSLATRASTISASTRAPGGRTAWRSPRTAIPARFTCGMPFFLTPGAGALARTGKRTTAAANRTPTSCTFYRPARAAAGTRARSSTRAGLPTDRRYARSARTRRAGSGATPTVGAGGRSAGRRSTATTLAA